MLQTSPVLDCAKIVSDVQLAGRLNEIRSLSGLGPVDPEIQRMLTALA